MVDTPTEKINIQLGDIIEIIAPDNPNLNLQQFYIEFINQEKLLLINIENQEEVGIDIIDGELADASIQQIELLSRADSASYAIQHNLVPGVWIEITFKTSDSLVIKGLITNLEEDMIEVKTYPENDIIYIDFAYQGLPEDFSIDKITIISNPESEPLPETLPKSIDEPLVEDSSEPLSEPQTASILQESGIDIEDASPEIIEQKIQEAILEGNQIELGEDLEEITIFVDVPEQEKRYSMEQQTDDLLDELLGTVPADQRTNTKLNEIHTIIERFVQLHQHYSIFDSNGNANKPEALSNNFKPLVNILSKFKKNLLWLIPVSINRKKLYNIDKTIVDELSSTTINNLNLGTTLEEEDDLFASFLKGQQITDDNNYYNYINKLNDLYTPFDETLDPTNSIISHQVDTNILSIVNNQDNNESLVAEIGKAIEIVNRKKFLFETYTKSLKYLPENYDLAKPDTITLNSVIILTLPFLLYSKINLPTTNILEKSILNTDYLYYWKFINNNTQISETTTIDSLINEIAPTSELEEDVDILNQMKKKIFNNIQQYFLDESLYNDSTNIDTYEKFLNKVIPNNIQCFNIVKNLSTNMLSIYSIVKQLELFHIYFPDVNFNLFEKLADYITSNITNYKSRLANNIRSYNSFSSKNYTKQLPSKWFKILEKNSALSTIVMESYNLEPTFTDNELFTKIYNIDNGELFTIALVRINLDLQTDNLLEEFVKKYEQSIANKNRETNDCKTITKKYNTLESLESDNGKDIYVDSEYDKTDYKFIDKLTSEQKSLPKEELLQILADKLVENKSISAEKARLEADNIINRQTLVQNGDFALLSIIDQEPQYFIRQDNVWIRKDLGTNVEIKDNKLFCNLQNQCISDDNGCNTFTIAESNLNETVLQQIYKEFDNTYDKQAEKIRKEIDLVLEKSIIRIKLLKRYKLSNFYKYDTLKRNIADLLDDEPELAVTSPYENLRDIILSQDDFVKRQHFIQKFVMLFTRPSFEYEDQYWLYCIKTSTKLLPLFISTLANKYISGGDYLYELDLIVTNQGTISDDGDSFVDKHSGYFIKKIEFDTEEGFTEEGFKLKTREKMEKDLGDHVLELADDESKSKEKVLSSEARLVSNIITAITGTSGMGINIKDQYNFIIDNVILLHKQLAPTEQQYQKMTTTAAKAKKTIASYEDQVGRPLIILTFIFISIAIQTNIPSIETRKTFPNCVKAFEGYPIFGDDIAAITYIACIARKMRNNEYPWSSIYNLKEEKIILQIKNLLDGKNSPLKNPSVKLKIAEKRQYNKTKRKDIKLDLLVIDKLQGFFPPLLPFTVKAYPLAEGFTSSLARNIKAGSYMQQDQINVIKSKIIKFGLSIQENIKKVIEKQSPLINSKSGVVFLENTCCDSTSTDIHKYFTEINSSLIQSNNIVISLSDILQDVYSASKAPILFDPRDSRYYYPELSKTFSTDTIYQAFIVFCKNKTLNLDSDIQDSCGLSSHLIQPTQSISEQIDILKKDGINYSEELFQQLLTIVNLKNIVTINLTLKYPNVVQNFTDVLNSLEDTPDEYISSQLVLDLKDLLDRYSLRDDSATGSSRKIKNFLDSENSKLLEKINLFIKSNAGLSKSKFATISTCLDNISKFLEIGDNILINSEDETTFKTINFIKNILRNASIVFPNIILNKINYQDSKIPKHWNLSRRHENDISEIINNYYKNLKPMYDDPELTDILRVVQSKSKNLLKLSETTPFFSSINVGSDTTASVFDTRLVLFLYKYYFLKTLEIYIDLSKLTQQFARPAEVLTVKEETPKEAEEEVAESMVKPSDEPEIPVPEISAQTYIAQATIAGARVEKMQSVAKYLYVIMEIICTHKKNIDYNKDSIMDKILISKEREKKDITDYLKGLTDEEREVENIFKNQKLEKWSKGLQKGLTQYVQETYDEEREQAEQEQIRDKKLAVKTSISDMNKNIYADEYDLEQQISDEIEREAYSLDDYGGEDEHDEVYEEYDDDF
jgi:hypothetical protein